MTRIFADFFILKPVKIRVICVIRVEITLTQQALFHSPATADFQKFDKNKSHSAAARSQFGCGAR